MESGNAKLHSFKKEKLKAEEPVLSNETET